MSDISAMQAQALQAGLEKLAIAQAQTAQVTAQGDAQIAAVLSKPKEVIYKDGMIVGVK